MRPQKIVFREAGDGTWFFAPEECPVLDAALGSGFPDKAAASRGFYDLQAQQMAAQWNRYNRPGEAPWVPPTGDDPHGRW